MDNRAPPPAGVVATAEDSLFCKAFASRLGYFEYPCIENFVKGKIINARPPLINRGYYLRVMGLRSIIKDFLDGVSQTSPPQKFQIVNVGAGSDPLFFWLTDEIARTGTQEPPGGLGVEKGADIRVEADLRSPTSMESGDISPMFSQEDVRAHFDAMLRAPQLWNGEGVPQPGEGPFATPHWDREGLIPRPEPVEKDVIMEDGTTDEMSGMIDRGLNALGEMKYRLRGRTPSFPPSDGTTISPRERTESGVHGEELGSCGTNPGQRVHVQLPSNERRQEGTKPVAKGAFPPKPPLCPRPRKAQNGTSRESLRMPGRGLGRSGSGSQPVLPRPEVHIPLGKEAMTYTYYELDYLSVLQPKAAVIRNTLSSLLPNLDKADQLISHPLYRMIALDFRRDSLREALLRDGFDSKLPTLFICECVLSYLPPETVNSVLQDMASVCESVCALTMFEPMSLNDRFGEIMKANLSNRGCPLLSHRNFRSIPSITEVLQDRGFNDISVIDMWTLYSRKYLDPIDMIRIEQLELFDEFEEYRLILEHYMLAVALKSAKGENNFGPLSIMTGYWGSRPSYDEVAPTFTSAQVRKATHDDVYKAVTAAMWEERRHRAQSSTFKRLTFTPVKPEVSDVQSGAASAPDLTLLKSCEEKDESGSE